MQTFQGLSSLDKFRVSHLLTRGKASRNPRIAAASVELAESFQHQNRVLSWMIRWVPVFGIASLLYANAPDAIDGGLRGVVATAVVLLLAVCNLVWNPGIWPKNVAQSLEASRQVLARRS